MSKKEYLRKKFLKLRKKNYFDINPSFFNPLISLLKKNGKKFKSISIYYPTNYEVNLLKIFQCNFFNSFEKLLPVILKKNTMIFYKWNYKEILTVNKFGILEPLKNGKNLKKKTTI